MTALEMYDLTANDPYGYSQLVRDEPDAPLNLLQTRITQLFQRTPKPKEAEESSRTEMAETAIDALSATAEWVDLTEIFSRLSESALAFLQDMNIPLQLIISIRESKEVALSILGKNASEKIAPSKTAMLVFSIINRLSISLASLQNFGIVAHAVVGLLRFSIIGSLCLLAGTGIGLGDSILRYTSFSKFFIAALKFASAAIALFVLFHLSLPLHILYLILVTSTLILSATAGSS